MERFRICRDTIHRVLLGYQDFRILGFQGIRAPELVEGMMRRFDKLSDRKFKVQQFFKVFFCDFF